MFRVLQLDIAGNPSQWVSHREVISMVAAGRVLANLGDQEVIFQGGHNRLSGLRSEVKVGTILLSRERVVSKRLSPDYAPPLTNKALFARDGMCMYCGEVFSPAKLTKDHVVPQSRGGPDTWTNCVTACGDCNHAKRDRTPEEWGKLLLAVPFTPNWAEFLFLKNRKQIVADQQAFLMARFPKDSRLM